jgi:adenine-specific DNA-methyltransferase
VEFLGSKRALTDFLVGVIARCQRNRGHVVDLYCGTATVAAALRTRGWQVTANDHLELCRTFAEAALLYDSRAAFSGLDTTYEPLLAELNSLPGQEGYIFANYSPAGGRMYLTEANAARVDAIRSRIASLDSALSRGERARLLVDLVNAVCAVSNTAGTYGCYLKQWKTRALEPLALLPAQPVLGGSGHEVHCSDAAKLVPQLTADVVYADPPYTKRQYAAYYHLLETIVLNDRPTITGSTGLRPWQAKASDWCYRKRAPAALRTLVSRLSCKHFFLSYNEDGQIPDAVIREILASRGAITVHEETYRRYRSSPRRHKGPLVRERLYHLVLA